MKRFNAVLTVLFILNVLTFAQWGGSQTRTTTKPSSTPMAYRPANTPNKLYRNLHICVIKCTAL